MKLKLFAFTFLTVCLGVVFDPKAVEAVSLDVIADGLDNPHGVEYGPDDNVYVTEAGVGGDGNCVSSPSALGLPLCYGNTSAITRITPDGQQERIVEGLPSLALQPSQNEGAGPQDIKFDSVGNPYVVYGYAGNPNRRDSALNTIAGNPNSSDELVGDSTFGQLYSVDFNTGSLTSIADIAKYELLNNPDAGAGLTEAEGALISNPYALEIAGDTAYIADAGGNAVYSVGLDGSNLQAIGLPIQTVTNPEFPPPDSQQPLPPGALSPNQNSEVKLQSVPTGVEVGPDGALYVSEFTSFPFPEGESRISQIGEDGKPEVFVDGFTQISDLEFDKDGNLLVLQFANEPYWKGEINNLPGSLIQVALDGTRTTLVAAGEGLESATALDVGPDGEIYVTNKGAGADQGQVVRVDRTEFVPETSSVLGLLAFGAFGGTTWLRRKRTQPAVGVKTC